MKHHDLIDLLNSNSIDAVLFNKPEELVMLYGYYPHYNGSIALVKSNGDSILFIPDFEPLSVELGCQLVRYPWGSAEADPWQGLEHLIREFLPSGSTLAFNASTNVNAVSSNAAEGSIIPANVVNEIIVNNYKSINIDAQLNNLFSVKYAHQVDALKLAHRVGSLAVDKFFDAHAGMTDGELAANIEAEATKQIGKQGVYYARAYACIQSGDETKNSCYYNKTGINTMKSGQLVFLELAICVNGFWIDLTRTTVIATPNQSQEDGFNLVYQALNAAVSIAKPGVKCADLYHAANNVFISHGVANLFPHALGHGVGFKYHEPLLNLVPENNRALEAGNIITIEPGLYGGEIKGGIRIEENILITEVGFEYLSTPQTLLRKK